jgi:hypothetical protein
VKFNLTWSRRDRPEELEKPLPPLLTELVADTDAAREHGR